MPPGHCTRILAHAFCIVAAAYEFSPELPLRTCWSGHHGQVKVTARAQPSPPDRNCTHVGNSHVYPPPITDTQDEGDRAHGRARKFMGMPAVHPNSGKVDHDSISPLHTDSSQLNHNGSSLGHVLWNCSAREGTGAMLIFFNGCRTNLPIPQSQHVTQVVVRKLLPCPCLAVMQ